MQLTKRLPLLVSVTSALMLACLAVYQSDVINDLRILLVKTSNELTQVKGELELEKERSKELEQQVIELTDSISVLNARIEEMRIDLQRLKTKVNDLNRRIQQQEDKVRQLTEQLAVLKASNKANAEKITALEKERDQLLDQMLQRDAERNKLKAEIERLSKSMNAAEAEAEEVQQHLESSTKQLDNQPEPAQTAIEDDRVEHTPAKKLASIVGFTEVRFGEIQVKENADGAPLRNVAGNEWRYVLVNFDLENKDPEMLLGEKFAVQLYDLDQGKVVPFNEANPAFPDSPVGKLGYVFTWEGKPIGIRYFNSQVKSSRNYEVRVYYYKDNMIYQLRNNRVRIIEDGRVIVG